MDERRPVSRQGAGNVFSLFHGVVPVLGMAVPAEDDVVSIGNVARGPNVFNSRLQILVHRNTVIDPQSGTLKEFGGRNGADSGDNQVSFDLIARLECCANAFCRLPKLS